ncbi:MAG: hypothetical protein WCO56_16545 [Verrucomicrobiota bacterium]
MKPITSLTLSVLLLVPLAALHAAADNSKAGPQRNANLQVETTVALPTPADERLVGLAYTTWFGDANWYNVWGTPQLGFYRSDDRAVIRRHAEWMVDAGVDFIFVDWSNNVDYTPGQPKHAHLKPLEEATTVLFDEFASLARSPKIAIMLGTAGAPPAAFDGRLQRKADQVWKTFVENPRYRPLLQEYLGKPLLIVYANTPSPYGTKLPWTDPRFTVRWMTGYVTQQPNLRTPDLVSHAGYWSWEDRGAQTYAVHDGQPEAMTVVASWREDKHAGIPAAGRCAGATFREQWMRARHIGPKFALVVSWNEWVRGEQPSAEISKDIEPSREHGRFYLDLLKEQITLFKAGK